MRAAVPLALTLAALLAASGCRPQPPDEGGYADRISSARARKDAQLLGDPEPVPPSRKGALLPLLYYPVDPAYNVPAQLTPSGDAATIMMPTSAGTQDEMRRVGTLSFTLRGEPLTLTAYVSAAAPTVERLFVPFRDLTSASDTYPAGRYLDLSRTATGIYAIDFNLAYNPYCYFNPLWICPLPPRENHLPIAVEAGEKVKAKQ